MQADWSWKRWCWEFDNPFPVESTVQAPIPTCVVTSDVANSNVSPPVHVAGWSAESIDSGCEKPSRMKTLKNCYVSYILPIRATHNCHWVIWGSRWAKRWGTLVFGSLTHWRLLDFPINTERLACCWKPSIWYIWGSHYLDLEDCNWVIAMMELMCSICDTWRSPWQQKYTNY